MGKKLGTVKDAAEYLAVRPSTVYEKAARGLIPRVVLWSGRRKETIRFDMDSLEEFVKKNTRRR